MTTYQKVVSISVPSVVLGVKLLEIIYRVCEKVSKKWQKRKRADGSDNNGKE